MSDPRIEQILALILATAPKDLQDIDAATGKEDILDLILLGLKAIAEEMAKSKLSIEQYQRDNQELVASLQRVKTLHGLLPICMYCKKIQNADGIWAPLEGYLSEHTHAKFTHGLCLACLDLHHSEE